MDNQRKFFQTPEFQKLNAKWKKKLAKDGFEDIEYDEDHLKQSASNAFSSKEKGRCYQDKQVYFESRAEYYRLAGQFLHDHPFENAYERHVWELHSEGISMVDIVAALKKKRIKTYKDKVMKTVQKLEAEMLKQCSIKKT
jgi:hypothetical protein